MLELIVFGFVAVVFLTIVFYSSHQQNQRWKRLTKRKKPETVKPPEVAKK